MHTNSEKQFPANITKNIRTITTATLLAVTGFSLASASAVTIDWVTVGNPDNPWDMRMMLGKVVDTYRIGKYEVTNAQYTEFLNAVDPTGAKPNDIYNNSMGTNTCGGIAFNKDAANGSKYSVKANMGNKPVNYVSWYDAARFTNWLHNGQGSGSTETGAYTLTGITGKTDKTDIIPKNQGASVWIPTEHEWYKAAYYDPTPGAGCMGTGKNYWLFATRSKFTPKWAAADAVGNISNPGTNVVNYGDEDDDHGASWNGKDKNVTTVGSAGTGSTSYYGTFDQNGNVAEWTSGIDASNKTRYYVRGGSFASVDRELYAGTYASSYSPDKESVTRGFRVAGVSHVTAPEIAIEQPAGTGLTDGTAVVSCGESGIGATAQTLAFTVRNTGDADLTGISLSANGANVSDFAIVAPGVTTLAPGASTTFTVSFTPSASGSRSAALHLASNDGDESPFDIALTGIGLTPIESWRFSHFETIENAGVAANVLDPDGDAMPSLLEYALNLDPQAFEDAPFVLGGAADTVTITYPRNTAATDVALSYEESDDLGINDPWAPAALTEELLGAPVNGVQQIKATRSIPSGKPRVFIRLVANPAP